MTRLSREELFDIVGELDGTTATKILATGASAKELREAMLDLEFFHELGERVPLASTSRVATVRELLEPAPTDRAW